MSDKAFSEVEKQGAFSRTWNSIRTRYSLATAFFLLITLAVFYIGGRIVLVHLIRDTEQQVKDIGNDISGIAYRNADRVRRAAMADVRFLSGAAIDTVQLISEPGSEYTFAALIGPEGEFRSGTFRADPPRPLVEGDFAVYSSTLRDWAVSTRRHRKESAATGIMRLGGKSHYVAMVTHGDGCLLLGYAFNSHIFTSQVNDNFAGFGIKVTNRKADLSAAIVAARASKPSDERSNYGIAPMFSEAIDYYSGGFWNLGASQFEAVYAIRDIAGNAISMVAVSIPKTFSSVTEAAIGRLAFFVALVGILFVLPIYWFQSKILLNPLSKMTEQLGMLGQHHRDTDCPRLEWSGKDEFALLAASVNRMLETISARQLAIAQSEARQKALIAAIPDALAIFDRGHRMVTMTKDASDPSAIPFAVPGEKFPEVIFGREGRLLFERTLDRVFETGIPSDPINLELQHAKWVPADHPTRHFEIRVVRIDNHFALALIRDITDIVAEHRQLVKAREKLKEGEKRESLALLAAGIAHDINNVLTIIANTVAATWTEVKEPGVHQAIDTIGDALKRGSIMMRELMEYAGESRIKFERAAPRQIITDIEMLMRGVIKNDVVFDYDVPEELPDIDAGRNQLWKVFVNIVKNAAEAIGTRPGHIMLKAVSRHITDAEILRLRASPTLKPGPGVLFTISDDGPGIRPDLLPKLFDPYVSSKSLGRGLGLATVASVVEAHGGGIRVDSVLERGTTFSIFLPEARLPKTVTAPDGTVAAPLVEGGDVLVVDDEESILRTTSMLLKALKYDPCTAKDNETALAEVRRHGDRLAAILLDASLGDVDTVRLAYAFRQNAPTVPIVISSGSSEEHIRRLFADVKIAGVLLKPYTLAELKAALASVVRKG